MGWTVITPDDLRPCANHLCRGLVIVGFCCPPCALAAQNGYEIHEDGPLGHSETCMARQRARGRDPRLGYPDPQPGQGEG